MTNKKHVDRMTHGERRVALFLAGILSTRMLGLFMILPVFAVYARELDGYSATLAGLAVGIYGLSQALLQIPLGRLSDKVGRKPIIIGGLLMFILGSVVAAQADSITGVIIGRALQGAGAIASAIMALAADLTREEHRMKVMAVIGMSIGASFALALVLGPLLHGYFGMSGIFWVTAIMAGLGIVLVVFKVPTPVRTRFHRDAEVEWDWLRRLLTDGQLVRLDAGVFILHLILTALFMTIPLILQDKMGLHVDNHWQIYLPVLLLSVVMAGPFIMLAEKRRQLREVTVLAVAGLGVAVFGLWLWSHHLEVIIGMLIVFFACFNVLEAGMPSFIAKVAPAAHKGSAMGGYTSAQFLGAFVGSLIGGALHDVASPQTVFLLCGGLVSVWLLLLIGLRQPPYCSSQMLNVGVIDSRRAAALAHELQQIPGVLEAVVIPEDGVAYLKVDKHSLDQDALYAYSVSS
ncbi:MAG: MFS transporter [Gammaproteobacteria bacterium]